jgi:hypothetical protein
VTETGRLHVDQNFAPHRGSDVDVFKIESLSERIDDECFHAWHPLSAAGVVSDGQMVKSSF